MDLTKSLWLLWLPCMLTGLSYDYRDYSDSYYNDISEGGKQEAVTSSPCGGRDQSRWDKLFTMLEDSHMRQNMILEAGEETMRNLREEIQSRSCSSSMLEESCSTLGQQLDRKLDLKLDAAVDEVKQAADRLQAQCSSALQRLENFTGLQASRLEKLENGYLGQVMMKSQQESGVDAGKLERVLMATAADLQRVHTQLTLLQRAAAHRYLPSGCEMALLFPMRSKHSFAEVVLSPSLSLTALSVCLWVRVTEALDRTVLFSYSSRRNPQELQLLLNRNMLIFTVGGEVGTVRAASSGSEGRWRHYCGLWRSEGGVASLWVDGRQVSGSSAVAQGRRLPEGGAVLLGQEKSSSGMYRDMDATVAFTGKITAVNMWSRALDPEQIRELANQDGACGQRGDVIGWGVSEILPHGGAQYIS
ncbi:pentraxin-related protein PTX3 [Colossoma macropomum]|uniref:pentraxin-related protein PTX3 n=1 Tax=Colossoma macropomum TaxID=42526 RepID=UPI00186536D1|nr:pentraxin-related protein PTX3 [Colossoma macropomum]